MKTKLTKEEQDILDSYERGEWVPVKNFSKKKSGTDAGMQETL